MLFDLHERNVKHTFLYRLKSCILWPSLAFRSAQHVTWRITVGFTKILYSFLISRQT